MQEGYIKTCRNLKLTKLSNFAKYVNISHSSQIHFAESVRNMSRQVLYNRQETTIRGDFKQSNFFLKSHVDQKFIKIRIGCKDKKMDSNLFNK